MDDLNDENWMIFAAKAYDKPNVLQSEFEEDISRILYLKRLISKYLLNGVLKERLILNHIIVFYNVFGIEAASRMLFLRLDPPEWRVLKPFLLFLNILPDVVENVRGGSILTSEIAMDERTINVLRSLK